MYSQRCAQLSTSMSDLAQAALITSCGQLLILLVTMRQSRNIQKIEKATNSMKDALIVAAHKEGVAQGTTDEESRWLKGEKL